MDTDREEKIASLREQIDKATEFKKSRLDDLPDICQSTRMAKMRDLMELQINKTYDDEVRLLMESLSGMNAASAKTGKRKWTNNTEDEKSNSVSIKNDKADEKRAVIRCDGCNVAKYFDSYINNDDIPKSWYCPSCAHVSEDNPLKDELWSNSVSSENDEDWTCPFFSAAAEDNGTRLLESDNGLANRESVVGKGTGDKATSQREKLIQEVNGLERDSLHESVDYESNTPKNEEDDASNVNFSTDGKLGQHDKEEPSSAPGDQSSSLGGIKSFKSIDFGLIGAGHNVELSDYGNVDGDSNSSSDESAEQSSDEDMSELDDEETNHYKTSFKQSKLFMSMQGFKSSAVLHPPADPRNSRAVKTDEDVASLGYGGTTYHRGCVYEYQQQSRGGKVVESAVGIISFIGEDKAKCVQVAKFCDTFLGVVAKGVENKDLLNFELSDFPKYVQVINKPMRYLTLHLSHFCGLVQEQQTIPDMIYEAQSDEDHWETFALYLSNGNEGETIQRRGLRTFDEPPTIAEYFAGAGGSHAAYTAKGFQTLRLVEKDDVAVQSLKANNSQDEEKIYHGCVEDSLNQRDEHTPSPTLSHWSSPCCGFSTLNCLGGVNDKANNDLSLLFVKMLQVDKSAVACFENVMGMWRRKHIHYLLNIIAGALKEGYQIRCGKINTSGYGDPQSRNRLFLLASRNGVPLPLFPAPQYGEGLLPVVTVGHVLKKNGAEHSHNTVIDTLPGQETRLSPLKPAPTITAQSRQPLHPFEARRINDQDMLALFSQRSSFELKGNKRERRRQVGNMIPFKTMSAIAEEIWRVLEFHYEE
ncbi:hypothetical protein ACHAXR_005163 [Thalassiosira sp. AJA248-18]